MNRDDKILTIKIVIDTNIYISAIFWGGNPRKVIDLARKRKIKILTSSEIEEEIMEKLMSKFGLDNNDASRILADFSTFTIPVYAVNQIQAVPDDPDDDKFIECAVSGKADYIVSGDKHLLRLREYTGIKILKAVEFLSIISKYEL